MKVEELRGSSDQFPKGMRVLAVDDDPICLKLLEALLLRCQYKVTTTDKAIVALELLRENKDKFDLVISDVHMPDMDGFKLLELVGLEMDLPVIMSSANGETQTVMKGITHGACDYLLKPVRIEELRNIWQHVVRRRKFEKRYHNNPNGREDAQNDRNVNNADDQGIADQNGKVRKLKIQIEEDEEDSEDSMQENDDSSSQKKARVVWTVDLHRKFVAAVKQLGVDKAVPKKVLDLMNVEKLTRENVASHLQKYRLYLKRLSAVAGQQVSVAAVAGGRNSSYLHTGSSNGLRNYYAMGESKQLSTHGSFQTNGISGSMNAPSVLRMHGLLPYQTIQLGGMLKNTSNLCDDLGRVQEIALPGNQQMSLPQRVPVSPKLERFEQPKLILETKNHLSAGLSDSGLAPGPCNNSFSCIGNNFSLQVNKQPNKSDGLGKYTSVRTSCSTSDIFKTDLQDASCFASICRSDGFQQGVGLTQASANVPILAPVSYNELSPITGENIYPITPHAVTRIHDDSSTNIKYLHHPTTRNDTWNKISSLSGNDQFECVSVPGGVGNDPSSSNSDIGSNSRQNWKYAFHSNGISSISSSSLLSNVQISDANVQCQPQDIFYSKMLDVDASDHVNFGAPLITENPIVDKANYDGQLNVKREYSLEPTTSCLQTHLDCTGYSLDDLVNAMIKPEPDDVAFLDMDLGFDVYSFGSCM